MLLDGVLVSLIDNLMWALLIAGAYLAAWAARDSRSTDSISAIAHRGLTRWYWWFVLAGALLSLITWYRLIPRRLARDGATIGMRQLGISAREANSGLVIGPGRAYARTVFVFLIGSLAQAGAFLVGVGLFGLHLNGSDANLIPPLGRQFTATLFWATAVACLLWFGPTLLFFVTRRRQTLPDLLTGVVFAEERGVNWWSVAAFGSLLVWPLSLVFGHVALFTGHRSRQGQAGRGLALSVLLLCYVVCLPLTAAVGTVLIAGGSTATSSSERQTLTSLLPTAATLPPDLVHVPPRSGTSYPDAGCQSDVFGGPTAHAETRYIGAQATTAGLPVGLDIWVGHYADRADTKQRATGSADSCSFSPSTDAIQPTGVESLVDNRQLILLTVPYRIGSSWDRHTVNLYAALASEGHYALMVLGADQAQVNLMGTELIAKLP